MCIENPNRFRRILLRTFLSVLLVVIILDLMVDVSLYPWDVIVLVIDGVLCFVLFFLGWRCPFCKKSLPRSDGALPFCPYCGKELPQDES